ncbi:MAG: hypothetical protein J3Q66DRAFT_381692 [Benniella sp.]|nr:MAG: hypothetical protein J3Q66DRAFT_381692 [Benniella sp.]
MQAPDVASNPHQSQLVQAWQNCNLPCAFPTSTVAMSSTMFPCRRAGDYEKLRDIIKTNYGLQLETTELNVNGWNWGETDFSNGNLMFGVQNKDMLEIPLKEVTNTSLTAKHEVMIELGELDGEGSGGKVKRMGDQLVELRFRVPGNKPQEGEGEKESASNIFYNLIKNEADIGDAAPGEDIVPFSDTLCLTPRGRHTTDYKIAYTSIIKLFLLPKPDEAHVLFVIGLDPPLRQGQTRYPFLVFQFVREEETDVTLNLDEETIGAQYEGKLEKKYETRTYEVVSTLLKALTGRRVTIPSEFFKSYHNHSAIKCSMKANEGVLYPLDKSFLFIPKPPTFIPHSEIGSVTFSRVGRGAASASRTFGLKFNMKCEYANLNEFLQTKSTEDESSGRYVEMIGASDSKKDAGKGKKKPIAQAYGGDDDEGESSPDEDFVADESESDVAEEFDEDVSGTASGSDDIDDKEKKKGTEPLSDTTTRRRPQGW